MVGLSMEATVVTLLKNTQMMHYSWCALDAEARMSEMLMIMMMRTKIKKEKEEMNHLAAFTSSKVMFI